MTLSDSVLSLCALTLLVNFSLCTGIIGASIFRCDGFPIFHFQYPNGIILCLDGCRLLQKMRTCSVIICDSMEILQMMQNVICIIGAYICTYIRVCTYV